MMAICLDTVSREEFYDYVKHTLKTYVYPKGEDLFKLHGEIIKLKKGMEEAKTWDLETKLKLVKEIL